MQDELKEYKTLKTKKWDIEGIPEDYTKPAFIISKQWHKQWKRYITEGEEIKIGSIDNKDIIDSDQDFYKSANPNDMFNVVLKNGLRNSLDYKVINDKQWEFLYKRYGGTAVMREKYKPEYSSYSKAEVYFKRIDLIIIFADKPKDVSTEKPLYGSKRWTIRELHKRIEEVLPNYGYKFPEGKFRLWKLDTDYKTLMNNSESIEGIPLNLFDDNTTIDKINTPIVVEIPDTQGNYLFSYREDVKKGKCDFCEESGPLPITCRCNKVFYCSKKCLADDQPFHSEKCTYINLNEDLSKLTEQPDSKQGIVGLHNLGGSLNSVIQCFSHIWPLTQYFLKDLYNKQGIMIKAFAKTIKSLWYDTETSITPYELNKVLNTELDSYELVKLIIETLNKELSTEAKGVANQIEWREFIKMNASIMTDLFYGENKVSMKCNKCTRCFEKYLVYSSVSLPVPRNTKVNIEFYYVPFNPSQRIERYTLTVDTMDTIDSLRERVGNVLGIDKYASMFTLISGGTFDLYLSGHLKLSKVVKLLNTQNTYLYIHQINPKIINSPFNIGIEAKRQECKEQAAEDFNNGLSDDIIKVPLNIYRTIKSSYWTDNSKERKTFNRLIYLTKNSTLLQVYLEVFSYFRPLFEKKLYETTIESDNSDSHPQNVVKEKVDYSKLTDKEFFEKVFPNITEENWNEKLKKNNDYPYTLLFLNTTKKTHLTKYNCFYCNSSTCINCCVPFTSELTVNDMLAKLNKTRNNYYYYEHGVYQDDKRELELEVVFNDDQTKCIVDLSELDKVNSRRKNQLSEIDLVKQARITLYDCFEALNTWQTEYIYCDSCGMDIEGKKKMELIFAPAVFVMQLKRFKTDNEDRINDLVEFPLSNLDISKYVKVSEPNPIYDLFAVNNYYIKDTFVHYTSFGLNKVSQEWYRFDDSYVTMLSPKEVCSNGAYLLFYVRKDIIKDIDYTKLRETALNRYSDKNNH